MKMMYLVGDDFLDAVDDLAEAVRDLPQARLMATATTLANLQAKRQKVQDMMDDGYETPTEGE